MVNKKMTMRDYYRGFITRANKEAGITFNASKLNNIKECEDYLLNLVKNIRHNKQDNKAYVKEIDSLKEEIEILNTRNKRLESERAFYVTQAEEAGKERKKEKTYKEFYKNMVDKWETNYKFQENKNKIISNFNIFLSFVIVLEAISIAMLLWK
mgnify:CR=1 FL=1